MAGPAGCRARADEAVLATLQRNVGSLKLRLDVCCERPRGVQGPSCWEPNRCMKEDECAAVSVKPGFLDDFKPFL